MRRNEWIAWMYSTSAWLVFICLAIVVCILQQGCSTINVTAQCPADAKGSVYVWIEQPKTVTTSPAVQGNVPIQGGEVTNPVNVTK